MDRPTIPATTVAEIKRAISDGRTAAARLSMPSGGVTSRTERERLARTIETLATGAEITVRQVEGT